MSEHIPTWVWALFGLGSPVQELINRWIPAERFRSLLLWAVAAGIVAGAVLLTPLDWGAFNMQLILVYAALTSGWALSNIVKPPLPGGKAVLRVLLIGGTLAGMAWGAHALAQDSTLVDTVLPEPAAAAGDHLFTGTRSFLVAQLFSFLGAVLTRWFGKARPGSVRAK